MEQEEELHLLRLSNHASASSQRPPSQISPPQASWPGKIMSGLGQWWGSGSKQSDEMQLFRGMVVSAAGTHVAILDGYQIIFLSHVNGFERAIGSSTSPLESGFYTCGAWLEDLEVFATMSSLKCIIIMDNTGKELSRTSLNWRKNAQAVGMFAIQMQNIGGGEKYSLAIYSSDCSIYQIEYGPEGFCGIGSEAVSHALMKNMHPKEVMCCDFNGDKSILALAGLSRGNRFAKSAGSYCLSLWRTKDFWRPVELLGYVDDLKSEDCSAGTSPSLKLILSPACNYVGLLDSGARLHLFNLKHSPDWILERMECRNVDIDGRPDDESVAISCQVGSQSKFLYFEVASVSDSKTGNGSHFENLSGIREACWWSENALALIKKDGLFVIASVPDLWMVSKFCTGALFGKICITYAPQRCIFLLETIPEEPQQQTMGSVSAVDLKRSGWRLAMMQEYTVIQLFQTLLESADFDFALNLADKYKLEKCTVYKQQWLLSNWDLETVEHTLHKIEDRAWVLKECLERVCPTREAMHALLRYGLDLVDLSVGSGHLKCAAQDAAMGYFCLSRLRLLQYSDRLETYLGLSLDRYCSKDYEVFRLSPLLDVAIRLAESGKTGAVTLLYKRHIYSLTPFLFTILDAFPETLSPHNYAQLLPTLQPFSPYIIGREKDWVEQEGIIEIIKKYDVSNEEAPTVNLYSSTEHVVNAHIGFVWPSETEVADWYCKRASTIDRVSGQLENALTLLDLGKQKGLSSLEDLWEDLSSLHWVTYNNSEGDEDTEMNLSLQDWQQLTDYEKFQAMLQGANESNVLLRLNERALPFLNHKTRRKTGTLDNQRQEVSFLVKWMKETASKDQLQVCATVLTEACKDFGSNKLFRSELEFIHTGLDCVYACPGLDQWDAMDTILSKLLLICSQLQPNSQTDQSSSKKHVGKGAARGVSLSMYNRLTENTSKRDNGVEILVKEGVSSALDRKIQQAMGHVDAGRLLSNYQVPKPIKFLEGAQNDERGVKQLILLMLSKFGRRQPARSDAEWAIMWDHLQRLQARAFTFLNRQFLFMEYYSSLLRAGKFSLAKSQLKGLGNNLLSPERVEAVIIQASRDYLFSASSLESPEIEKARLCLNLVPESKSIVAELDYIDTVTKKLPALGVSLLPMQVKQTKDPMEIVRRALMSSSLTGDLQVDNVMYIARSLGLNSEDQIAEVKEAIARQAAASGHIGLALDFCLGLIRKGHGSIWDFCAALARGPELDGMSLQLRKELLGFAISHCDDSSIGQLLQTWKEIDLFERGTVVKEATTVEVSSGFFFEEGLKMEVEYDDLQHQEGLLSKGLRQLLCKVAHIESTEDLIDDSFISKDQKKILHILCLHLPWLLQAADAKSQNIGNWQHDGLVSKSLATMLLGLAHSNLIARDELLCHLARVAISRLSKDRKSLIGCGYLLNLVDSHRGGDLLEQEMQHVEELTESCEVFNLALKYGSLLQEDAVSPTNSPKSRRERLLMTLRQSKPGTVSGTIVGSPSESEDTFWRQWRSKVLKRLEAAEHALELKPIIANFKEDQFNSGAESYVKDTVLSVVKSAVTRKSSESEQASRVDRYQSPNQTHHLVVEEWKGTETCSLNLGILESKLKSFKKYLKNLNVDEIWLSIQTLMTATAMAVLEEQREWYEDDDEKERLGNLLHFWVKFFEDLLDDESSRSAMSRQAVDALLELRVCCGSFEKLMQENAIPGLQSREVISKLVNFQGCEEEERVRFLKAMVSSGCPYQTVLFVWQNTTENVKCDNSMKVLQVSNIYVQVINSSIETCSVLCESLPFDGCCLHLEPALKAVASLSKTIESDDENLQQGLVSLHEVRLCVWKTICHFAENLNVPSFLRVWLFKLREAISGHKQAAAFHNFESYLKNDTVSWVGWDITGLAGETTPPLQQTITALKSMELVSTVWHDLTIKAEDLVSVEAASSLFHCISANVEHAQHADLLIKLLEEWGDIFGWENASDENSTEHLTAEEDNEHMDPDWGHADGWDDVWDESDEVMASSEFVKGNFGGVNALHTCWKAALEKLISFREMDSLLHSLDSAYLRNGRTILTKEESFELISLFAQEDPATALKVSLLLPYKEAQDQALQCLDNKIRDTRNSRQEMEGIVGTVDDCLLILILASGRFSAWIDDLQFSASFRSICAALASVVQTDQFSSAFTRDVVLPYFVASLTPTSQYTAACALVMQYIRVHPAFVTWNGARAALDKFLKVKASMPDDDLKNSYVHINSLSCISNSAHYLQSQLRETLCSALQFLSNISL